MLACNFAVLFIRFAAVLVRLLGPRLLRSAIVLKPSILLACLWRIVISPMIRQETDAM
jgi:hypothetical protein